MKVVTEMSRLSLSSTGLYVFMIKNRIYKTKFLGENMPAVILFYRISFSEQNDIFALFKHYTSNIHDELIEASNVISNDHASDKTMILMELLLILWVTNLNWNRYVFLYDW